MKLKHIVKGLVVSDILLTEGELTIGRNEGNHLRLDDASVSGEHARLIITPNEYMPEMLDVVVEDMDSTNGVYVNADKISRQKLKHDDVVRIGHHEFKLYDEQSYTGTQTEYYVPDNE